MKQCIRCGSKHGDMFRLTPGATRLPGIPTHVEEGWCHNFDTDCWIQVAADRHNLEHARESAKEWRQRYFNAARAISRLLDNLQKIQNATAPSRLKVVLEARKLLEKSNAD